MGKRPAYLLYAISWGGFVFPDITTAWLHKRRVLTIPRLIKLGHNLAIPDKDFIFDAWDYYNNILSTRAEYSQPVGISAYSTEEATSDSLGVFNRFAIFKEDKFNCSRNMSKVQQANQIKERNHWFRSLHGILPDALPWVDSVQVEVGTHCE